MPHQSSLKDTLEKINLFVLRVIEKRLKTLQQWDPKDISDGEDSGSEDFDAPVILCYTTPPMFGDDTFTILPCHSDYSDYPDRFTDIVQRTEQWQLRFKWQFSCILYAARCPASASTGGDQCTSWWSTESTGTQPCISSHNAGILAAIARPFCRSSATSVLQEVVCWSRNFDRILEQISGNDIFIPKGNQLQLSISIQLAIFPNRAGHYGNAISLEDIAQWAGVSVGSVNNCTNHVMVALLQQHDHFLGIPGKEEAEIAQDWVEEHSCSGWRNGIFAADGSAINFFAKPGVYGETFYDRKSRYSLNCQVCWCVALQQPPNTNLSAGYYAS